MITTPCDLFISKLQAVSSRGEGAWAARCPAHGDEAPSLFVVDKTPKGFHVTCAAGCSADAIVEAVQMTRADRLGQLAKKVKLDLETPGIETTFYDYHNEAGELEFQKVRFELAGQPKTFKIRRKVKGSWKWDLGPARPVPFRLPALLASPYVIITEGEKAALRVISEGLVATTLPDGASSRWLPWYADLFRGKKVAILPDHDLPGKAYASRIALELHQVALDVRTCELPDLREGEDVYDWFARGGTREQLEQLLRDTAPFRPDQLAQRFDLTETGNADRLVRFHAETLRYVADRKEWIWWDGVRWRPDDTQVEIYRRGQDVLRRIGVEAETAKDGDEAAAYQRHIRATAKKSGLDAMIHLAGRRAEVAITSRELDAPDRTAYLLAASNGIIDLRTGELTEARPETLISKRLAVKYVPDAPAPRWEKFVSEIRGDKKQEVDFLQRWLGYCLTGDASEHKLVMMYGSGANGKSKLLNTIRIILGSYAATADISTFTAVKGRSGPRDDLACLEPARLVVSSEADDGSFLDEAVIKLAAGEDSIKCRHLYGQQFEYMARWKLNIMSNHKPRIRGTDHGIWRRIVLVPFVKRFPVDRGELQTQLDAEREGILAWLVRGALEWQRHGLMIPETVERATAEYRAEQDPIGAFIDDACLRGDLFFVPEKFLFVAYRKWCEENHEIPFQVRRFRQLLDERNVRATSDGGRAVRRGIGLRAATVRAIKAPAEEVIPAEEQGADEPVDEELPFMP